MSDDNPYVVIIGRDPQGPIKMDGEDADGINHSDMKTDKCVSTPKLSRAHRSVKKQALIEWVEHNPGVIVSPKEFQASVEKKYPQLSLSLILDTIRALKIVYPGAKLRIITTPVVDPKKVPLNGIRHISWSEYVDLSKLIEEIIKGKPTGTLLLVLFCTKSDELGKNNISKPPDKVQVAVVFAPTLLGIYPVSGKLESMIQQKSHPEKPTHLLLPGNRVQSTRNRKVWEIGDSNSTMNCWQADRIVVSTTRSSGLSKKVSNDAPELSRRIGPFHNNPRRPYPSKEVAHMLSRRLPVTLVRDVHSLEVAQGSSRHFDISRRLNFCMTFYIFLPRLCFQVF
uniref:Uncharacterized protein n=1 Tax=Caenorhabditis japonica TaxID=281687 RepID=A0A8R1DMR3_CAEJA